MRFAELWRIPSCSVIAVVIAIVIAALLVLACSPHNLSMSNVCGTPTALTDLCRVCIDQARVEAMKAIQSARRLTAHAGILSFLMEAGLNRQRLEFAATDLSTTCDRVATEAGSATAKTDVLQAYTSMLSAAMESFLVASRHCSFIASVQQEDKMRREEEEKRLEAVSGNRVYYIL
jgi:hypothetical protein